MRECQDSGNGPVTERPTNVRLPQTLAPNRPFRFPPDLPVCSVMQEQTGSSRLLPGRLDAGYMLLESGHLQIVRLANIEGLYDDLTKFLIAGDFELSDRTNLKEHLLNGKTLLLDLSKSDSLRKLSDCYQD